MANLKLDNLYSSLDILVKNNLVIASNQIKENYLNSTTYIQSKNSTNQELSILNESIQGDLKSLSNQLQKFNTYLSDYINDYLSVNKYLTDGSRSGVKSIPTLNALKSSSFIKNDNLKQINIINLNLIMDYVKGKE